MDFANVDARLVTAVCLWIIGAIVWGFTIKIWWTPLSERPFLFGPYLTPDGVRLILPGLTPLFLIGAVAMAGGLGRFAYWLRSRGMVDDGLAATAGLVEAAFSLWAAGALILFTIRTWLKWRQT